MSAIDIQKFGKYEIIEELGRGGMGVVYKARDPLIGRLVALKTLTADSAADPDLLKRFDREAQAAGRLQHPNIVTIYDIGNANGTPFIAMEFLEGESLEKIIARRETLPLANKLDILLQFCRGLAYAHKRDVVHRDIKPANIFVKTDGTVKIVDFGVVHISDTSMTQTGMVIGTIPYMSPEQVSGQHIDQRSDICSVGTVAYEFVAGTKPFDGPNMPAIMLKIVQGSAVPLSQLVPDVPPELEQAIMRCLEREPDNRFQSLDDLILELEPLEQSLKRQRIGELVGRGQALYEQKEYAKAREVLHNVLVLDSAQTQAKTLMAKIVTEMRRQEVASRVERLVGEGDTLLHQGKNVEAGRALEEAVKLDSGHTHARVLLEEARKRVERERMVSEQIAAIQAALGKGQITVAETALSRLREVDAAHHEAAVFEERIKQARAHERRLRMQQALRFPQHLLDQERWEEAVQQLEGLRQEFSGETEIEDLYQNARRKLVEQQRRREFEAEVADVRQLIAAQDFQTAVGRLAKLSERSSQDPENAKLFRSVQQQFDSAARQQRVGWELAAIQDLIRRENYPEAMREAEAAVKRYPESQALASLFETARRAQAEKASRLAQESASQRVNQEISTIEKLLAVKDYSTALERSESLRQQYPDRPEVGRLLERIRTARLSVEQKQVAAYCQAIQTSLETGEAQRACEEAEHALRYFPGNADITALLTAARTALRERASRREPLSPTTGFPPSPSPLAPEPRPEEDASATSLFRPGAILHGESPAVEGGRLGEQPQAAAFPASGSGATAESGLRRPAATTETPQEFAPRGEESIDTGGAGLSVWLERLRNQPKRLMVAGGAVLVVVVLVALAIVYYRRIVRSRQGPPTSPIEVTIATDPPGAAVRIDGEDKGSSPVEHLKLAPGKTYQLVASKEGYQDLSQSFEVPQSGQALQPFALQPLPIKLQLLTGGLENPQIQWDGNASGGLADGEWELDDVGKGPHTLTVSGSSASAELKFEANPGSIPVLDGPPATKGLKLMTVTSLGNHALIQFFGGVAPREVKLDDQTYKWMVDGVDVPSLSGTSHTLKWQDGDTTFESGPGPQLIVFLKVNTKGLPPPPPPPTPQPPSNPHATEIADLLSRANQAIGANHYAEPAGDNAIEYANKVLQFDGANELAIQYRQYSIQRTGDWIHNDLKAGSKTTIAEARRLVNRLSELLPDDSTVKNLQEEVEKAEQAENVKHPPAVVVPKPVFTAKLTYSSKTGKPSGTLTVIGQHVTFKAESAGGPTVDIACSDVAAFNPKGRHLGIGQKGFRLVTKSRQTYEFLSDSVIANDIKSACNKK